MVNEKEQTRKAILELITYVCGLPLFDRKKEIVDTLYTLEWSLRPEEEKMSVDLANPTDTESEYEAHWE